MVCSCSPFKTANLHLKRLTYIYYKHGPQRHPKHASPSNLDVKACTNRSNPGQPTYQSIPVSLGEKRQEI